MEYCRIGLRHDGKCELGSCNDSGETVDCCIECKRRNSCAMMCGDIVDNKEEDR